MPAPPAPERRTCCPSRPGFLANPRSSRFARRPATLRDAAGRFPGALYREASDPAGIAGAFHELVADGADIIIVLGGDGTLQAALNQVGSDHRNAPVLAAVPCGSTNMTALDVGTGQSPLRVLKRLRERIDARAAIPVTSRPMLRIQRRMAPALQGMFFGAGTITAGVRYFRDRIRGRGLTGEAASGIAVLRTLAGLLAGRVGAASTAVYASLAEEGAGAASGSFMLLLASTLDRLLLGARPYWGREPAPIHFTAIRDRPARFWPSLPGIVRGRPGPLPEPDYHSRNLHGLELTLAGDFVLDGEIHAIDAADATLRISAEGPALFAVP